MHYQYSRPNALEQCIPYRISAHLLWRSLGQEFPQENHGAQRKTLRLDTNEETELQNYLFFRDDVAISPYYIE
jgi:hypothetical protein